MVSFLDTRVDSSKDEIISLCEKYSNLTETQIQKIIQMAELVETFEEMMDYDVFIDVSAKDNNAPIVVYHCKPKRNSMYIYSPVGQRAEKENEPGVWRTLKTGESSRNFKAKTQENQYVTQNIYPIKDGSTTIGTLITEKDISNEIINNFYVEDYEKAALLSSTLKSINNLDDYLEDVILIFNESGKLLFKNKKADLLFYELGYEEDISGKHFDDLAIQHLTFEDINTDKIFNYEVRLENYYYSMKKVMLHNREWKVAFILHDITQLKCKDEELSIKTTAIQEIHHRIKNNLQTIASLLRIQSRRSNNMETKRALKDSVNRILSIAATHELLSKKFSDGIHLNEVIPFVLENIQRSYTENDNIKIHFSSNEACMINSDQATVIALIINELVQNCYDHAFTASDEGSIHVDIQKVNATLCISVQDDGIGFESKEDVTNSLGISIVQSYVADKLKGELFIERLDNGTIISFQFPVE